uniref:Uncharacterized protein n=1 Tax=viral metagenome TaxID=1070528 RepID=A0A6H2A687_9ZZZZ
MKIRYIERWFGKERVIVIRETKNGYPGKKAWRKLGEILKDGCWWVKGEDESVTPKEG